MGDPHYTHPLLGLGGSASSGSGSGGGSGGGGGDGAGGLLASPASPYQQQRQLQQQALLLMPAAAGGAQHHRQDGRQQAGTPTASPYLTVLSPASSTSSAGKTTLASGASSSKGSGGSGGGGSKSRGNAIIESHRKTEWCRNWPNCRYGSRCAFAHSKAELRRLSLEEMEQAGRIPDARKYRVYPCLTWLSTGACPYRDRCVFIHDPRIRGERPAYLYATPGSNATRHSAKSSPLFWPDLPAPAVGTDDLAALYSASIEYEVVPRDPHRESYFERSVRGIWTSYRTVMAHLDALGHDQEGEKDKEDGGGPLYGRSCQAPVKRLPIYQAISNLYERQRELALASEDEEAAALAGVSGGSGSGGGGGGSGGSGGHGGIGAAPGTACFSTKFFPSVPQPPSSSPSSPAAYPTTPSSSTRTSGTSGTSGSQAVGGVTPLSPFGSPPLQPRCIASLQQPQPPAAKPSRRHATGSGALWPPSRPSSTPSSRAGTAPPSPMLLSAASSPAKAKAAIAAAAAMAAAAAVSMPLPAAAAATVTPTAAVLSPLGGGLGFPAFGSAAADGGLSLLDMDVLQRAMEVGDAAMIAEAQKQEQQQQQQQQERPM